MVNLLLAGVEDDGTPSLYFMDYLASMVKVCWYILIFALQLEICDCSNVCGDFWSVLQSWSAQEIVFIDL